MYDVVYVCNMILIISYNVMGLFICHQCHCHYDVKIKLGQIKIGFCGQPLMLPPFTTYPNIQKFVGGIFPEQSEGLVNALLGRKNNSPNELPSTVILQSKVANTQHWIDALKDRIIFQIQCRPRGWFFDEPEGYLSLDSSSSPDRGGQVR